MALALYRKYRPRTFAEVIGQEHVTEPLSQALRSGRLHHAYLFSGPRGCGKTSSARILARSLNCEQGPTPDPCGICASCRSLTTDGAGSIDVIEIDAASHGGVDDARDLREKAFFAPASSRYKIYVIDEAHMVSSAGFNALLKLVEEPPDYVKFIFATTEPEKVLGTIRSRTHHYPFRLIPPATLRPYLQQLTEAEGVHVEPAVFPLVVKAGAGSARDSLSVLDQLIAGAGPEGVSYTRALSLLGVTDAALIDEMCDALAAGDGAAAYTTIDRVAEAGHDTRRFASDLLERFRDLIVLQQVPDAVAKGLIDGPADQLEAMSAQAVRLGPAMLSRCADIVHNGLVEMRGTTAPRLLLELITARMLLPGAEDSTGALLQRLERMERRLTLSGDDQDLLSVRAQPAPAATSNPVAGAGAPEGGGGQVGGVGISAARAAAAAAARRAPAGTDGVSPSRPAAPAPGGDRPASSASGPDRPMAATSADRPEATASGADRVAPRADRPVSAASETALSRPAAANRADADSATDLEEPPPWDVDEEDFHAPGTSSGTAAPELAGSAAPELARAVAPESAGPVASTGSETVAGASSGIAEQVAAAEVAGPAPRARQPEPAGLLPDAPEEPAAVPVTAGAPGRLDAAAIREVWPEIMTVVGRQSKKVAALASGATVRDLDGQTVVLTFRFPAHAKMVAAQPELITDALYEALGDRWQIRCEVAGEAGGTQLVAPARNPARSGPAQPAGGPARSGPGQPAGSPAGGGRGTAGGGDGARNSDVSTARNSDASPPRHGDGSPARNSGSSPAGPGRQREAAAPAPAQASGGDDDWPEPASPGGVAVARRDSAETQPGTASGPGSVTSPGPTREGAAASAGTTRDEAITSPGSVRAGTASVRDGAATASVRDTAASAPVRNTAAAAAAQPGAAAQRGTDARADTAGGGRAVPSGGGSGRTGNGLAAARAAAAGAGKGPAKQSGAWSDGSPTEEAPYDPEYDGPVRPGGGGAKPVVVGSGPSASGVGGGSTVPGTSGAPARNGGSEADGGYDGFDPGDEPLDDVIDEKTARQSSEQQAMRLLQDAFGAEKIGES